MNHHPVTTVKMLDLPLMMKSWARRLVLVIYLLSRAAIEEDSQQMHPLIAPLLRIMRSSGKSLRVLIIFVWT